MNPYRAAKAVLDSYVATEVENGCDQSPLDRVKSAILELPKESQHEIYKFLYTLGHRIF